MKRLGALILAVSSLTAIAGRLQAQPAPRDPDFSGAARAATALPQLHSLLVSWRGELVVEYYAKGAAQRASRT